MQAMLLAGWYQQSNISSKNHEKTFTGTLYILEIVET